VNENLRLSIIEQYIKRKIEYSPYQTIEYNEIKHISQLYNMSCKDVVKNIFLKNNFIEGNPIKFNKECQNIKKKYLSSIKSDILRKVVIEKTSKDYGVSFDSSEIEYYSKKSKINVFDFMLHILDIKQPKLILDRLKTGKITSSRSFPYEESKKEYMSTIKELVLKKCVKFLLEKEESTVLSSSDLSLLAKLSKINEKDIYINILNMSMSNYNNFLRNNKDNIESRKLKEEVLLYLDINKKIILHKIVKYKLKNIDCETFSKEHLIDISKILKINLYYIITHIFGKSVTVYYDLKNGNVEKMQKTDEYILAETDYIKNIEDEIYCYESFLHYGKISDRNIKKISERYNISLYNLNSKILKKGNIITGPYVDVPIISEIDHKIRDLIVKECVEYELQYGTGYSISIDFLKKVASKYKVPIKIIMLDIFGKKIENYDEYRHGNLKKICISDFFEVEKIEYIERVRQIFERDILLKNTKVKYTYEKIKMISQELKISEYLFVTEILGKSKASYYDLKTERTSYVTFGEYVLSKIPNEFITKNYNELNNLVAAATMKVFNLYNRNIDYSGYSVRDMVAENILKLFEKGNIFIAEEGRYLIEENETQMLEKHRMFLYKTTYFNSLKLINSIVNKKIVITGKSYEVMSQKKGYIESAYNDIKYDFGNIPAEVIDTIIEKMDLDKAINSLVKKGYDKEEIITYIKLIKEHYEGIKNDKKVLVMK